MKIMIFGFSGSGKSTLATYLANHYRLPVLYLDQVHFLPNWVERNDEDEYEIVEQFLNHNNQWVIDGNYTRLQFERRCEEADLIIYMNFNRYDCYHRAKQRYEMYKGKTRKSMSEGCEEKFDLEFMKWILWEGRSDKIIQRNQKIVTTFKYKTIVIHNQKELDDYMHSI